MLAGVNFQLKLGPTSGTSCKHSLTYSGTCRLHQDLAVAESFVILQYLNQIQHVLQNTVKTCSLHAMCGAQSMIVTCVNIHPLVSKYIHTSKHKKGSTICSNNT